LLCLYFCDWAFPHMCTLHRTWPISLLILGSVFGDRVVFYWDYYYVTSTRLRVYRASSAFRRQFLGDVATCESPETGRDATRRDSTRLDSRATTNCAETRPPSPITSLSRATQERAGGDVRSAADCDQSGTAAAAAAAATHSTRVCSDNGSSTNSPRRCNTFTDRVSRQGNAIGRVRPAVRFSYFIQRVL